VLKIYASAAVHPLKVAIIDVLRVIAWEPISGYAGRNNFLTVFITYYVGEDYVPSG